MTAVFPGAARLSAAVARVLDSDGAVVGAAFLIGTGRLATCAHVVAAAVEAEVDGATATVAVDFPLAAGAPRAMAAVRRWEPVRADGGGDIAVLELDGAIPCELAPPPLWWTDRPWGREFRAVGFPAELPHGVWTCGEFRDRQATGWLQLHGAPGGQPITGGFSGAPVWDVGSEAVVGMAVAADRRRFTRTAFMVPVTEVLGVDPALLPNPYRGLEPFTEADASLFYGRDADIARIVDTVRRRPVVAVTGRSGIGKSSLVMAGVVARLRSEGMRITYVGAETGVPDADSAPALLVADQFEELVSTEPARAAELLRALLVRTRDPAVRVLLTLRWDTVDELADEDLVHALAEATVPLLPMGRDQLRQAIRGPASHAPGVYVDDDLVERLVDDTGDEPGCLPLLESLMTELWAHRTGGRLTVADYERVGRAATSIARCAERIFGQFTEPADADAARRLLTMLAAPRGDAFVRVPVSMRDRPELRSVAGRLARERLVVTGEGADGADIVELAHQSLIENWPRLRGWLAADRDFLDWQRQTDEERRRWESRGQDEGGLPRGSALSTAEEWLANRPGDIPEPLRRYIHAGARVRRREVRRWRVVTAVLAVVSVVAAVTAGVAYRNSAQRVEVLRLQAGAALAERSLQLATTAPSTALQFAQAAARLAPDDHRVEAALLTQQLRLADAVSIRSAVGRDVRLVAADDTGGTVAIGDGDGTVAVWPGLLDGGAEPWRLPVTHVVSLALSGDGTRLVTTNSAGGIQLWDVPRRVGPLQIRQDHARILPSAATAVQLSRDGARLVVSRDPLRSAVPAGHTKRLPFEVGGADLVEMFDTTVDPPRRVGTFSAAARADLVPLRVDAQRQETWFAEFDESGAMRTVLRDIDGGTVDLGPGDPARGSVRDCGDGRSGDVVVHEPSGPRAYGLGAGCLTIPSGAVFDRDRTGRYLILSYGPEGALYQLIRLVDTITGQVFKLQARYQTSGKPAYLVRPGAAGPELFTVGSDDLTRHAAAAPVDALTEFDGAAATAIWSGDGRYLAELRQQDRPPVLTVREVMPRVRPVASVALEWPAAARNMEMTFTADNRYLVAGFDSHELHVYAMPQLRLVTRITLPVPEQYRAPQPDKMTISVVAQRDDVVAVLHAGYVTRWRAGDGSMVGVLTKQQPWRTPEELAVIANSRAMANGSNVDELAIFTRREILVWNAATELKVRTVSGSPTGWIDTAFKTPGIPIAYVWTELRRVERWDTETGRTVAAPIPIPWAPIVEPTVNELVFIGWENGKFEIIDAERGALVDSMVPGNGLRPWVTRNGTTLLMITGSGLLTMNLDRADMHRRLCAVSDRAFTAAERELLPPGADATPPCRT